MKQVEKLECHGWVILQKGRCGEEVIHGGERDGRVKIIARNCV